MQELLDGLSGWPSCGGTVTSKSPLVGLSTGKHSQLLLPSGFSGRCVCCSYPLRNRTEGQEKLLKCFEAAHGRRGSEWASAWQQAFLGACYEHFRHFGMCKGCMPRTASKQTGMVGVQLGLVYDRLELGLSAENKVGIGWTLYQLHLLVCGCPEPG